MRMLGIGMLALAGCAATPASAQIAGSMRGLSGSAGGGIRGDIVRTPAGDPGLAQDVSIRREVGDLRAQIRDARDAGQLSRREARALRREGFRIEAASDRYGRDGYSDAELALLRSRTEALRSGVVAKRSQALAGK